MNQEEYESIVDFHLTGRLPPSIAAIDNKQSRWNFKRKASKFQLTPNNKLLYIGSSRAGEQPVLVVTEKDIHDIMSTHHGADQQPPHPGFNQTFRSLSRHYYWPGMSIDTRRFVSGCEGCQVNREFNTSSNLTRESRRNQGKPQPSAAVHRRRRRRAADKQKEMEEKSLDPVLSVLFPDDELFAPLVDVVEYKSTLISGEMGESGVKVDIDAIDATRPLSTEASDQTEDLKIFVRNLYDRLLKMSTQNRQLAMNQIAEVTAMVEGSL